MIPSLRWIALAGCLSGLALTDVQAAAPVSAELPPVEPHTFDLWPDGSPNNPAEGMPPRLRVYRPFAVADPDVTLIILPGGGYRLHSPYEQVMAEFFRGLGYAVVVVEYRLVPHRYPAAFADALRAVRMVRRHGREWGLPGSRIALLGASAGGHLAALVATRPEVYRDSADDLAGTVSARPDLLILLYPVITAVAPYRHVSITRILEPASPPAFFEAISPERHVTAETPPTIIFHAADDASATVNNSLDFAQACWAAGVPAELHVFPRGGHGRAFAYDPEVSPRWREILRQWLNIQRKPSR